MTAADDRRTKLAQADLSVGKRYWLHWPGAIFLALRHPEADRWLVDLATTRPEGYDDDPGSRTCGCRLEGTAHTHRVVQYASQAEAIEAFIAAEAQAAAGQSSGLYVHVRPRRRR